MGVVPDLDPLEHAPSTRVTAEFGRSKSNYQWKYAAVSLKHFAMGKYRGRVTRLKHRNHIKARGTKFYVLKADRRWHFGGG